MSRSGGDIEWDGNTLGPWVEQIGGPETVIVNLAGSPISVKWTPENREKILKSRLEPTRAIGEAIRSHENPPWLWINVSAVGFYGDRGDEFLNEASASGTGFLADVGRQWEACAMESGIDRLCRPRIGVVLASDGGALPVLARLTKAFLGGAAGDGRQFMPWVHVDDLANAFVHIANQGVLGPVNIVAPEPARNADFMRALRSRYHRPFSPSIPAFAMRAVGKLVGPDASLVLDSTRAVPSALIDHGFQFKHEKMDHALANT